MKTFPALFVPLCTTVVVATAAAQPAPSSSASPSSPPSSSRPTPIAIVKIEEIGPGGGTPTRTEMRIALSDGPRGASLTVGGEGSYEVSLVRRFDRAGQPMMVDIDFKRSPPNERTTRMSTSARLPIGQAVTIGQALGADGRRITVSIALR